MNESIRAAAVDLDSKPDDYDGNLAKIDAWCARAAEAGAALVLFPELSLGGFLPNHPQGDHAAWIREALATARRMARRIDSPEIAALAEVAKRHAITLSCGMLEDAGALLYNTQVLVEPTGLVSAFRKMHVPLFEMPFYQGGDAPSAVPAAGASVSVNICFDALLPESTRLSALAGAEFVLFPFAADPPPGTAAAWGEWAMPAVRARCVENGVFGLAANYRGEVIACGVTQRFPGGLFAVGPRGEVLAERLDESTDPQMLLVELSDADLAAARAEPEFLFRFRRPELYGPLADGGPSR